MIAKSKKFKYERQKEKEQLLNEFEKFDEEFKSIRSLTKDFDRTADQKVCLLVKLSVFKGGLAGTLGHLKTKNNSSKI